MPSCHQAKTLLGDFYELPNLPETAREVIEEIGAGWSPSIPVSIPASEHPRASTRTKLWPHSAFRECRSHFSSAVRSQSIE